MFRPFYDLKEQLESKLEVIYMFLFIQPVLLQSSCMYLNRSILIVRIAVWARESCWSAASTLFKMLCKELNQQMSRRWYFFYSILPLCQCAP